MSVVQELLSRTEGALAEEIFAHAGKIAEVVGAGRACGPDVVSDEAWALHLSRHLESGAVAAQLGSVHSEDVQLALACLAGHAGALAQLDAKLRSVAPRALGGIRLGEVSLDDVLQDVREKLFLARDGAAPKLASYSGRGPLDAWLRVTVARAALSAVRSRTPDVVRREDDAILEGVVTDPRIEALRQKYAPLLSRTVEAAVASLPEAERALLRMNVIDGLSIDDLAAIYGAHRATMARRLAKARTQVAEAVKERAGRELGLGEDDFASLMGLVLSRLDVTLRRAIGSA